MMSQFTDIPWSIWLRTTVFASYLYRVTIDYVYKLFCSWRLSPEHTSSENWPVSYMRWVLAFPVPVNINSQLTLYQFPVILGIWRSSNSTSFVWRYGNSGPGHIHVLAISHSADDALRSSQNIKSRNTYERTMPSYNIADRNGTGLLARA
jgi:hypothetical protein